MFAACAYRYTRYSKDAARGHETREEDSMFPLDPATGPDESPRARARRPVPRRSADGAAGPGEGGGPPGPADGTPGPRPDTISAQAVAQGGTFVRPGAIAWGKAPGGPGNGPPGADEVVQKALAALAEGDGDARDLLDELARARVWVPLPAGPGPVTDGSAVTLPVVTYLGADFVPCFTSAERLARYAGRRRARAADARRIPHIVVPAAALARRLPPGLGMALNPGAETSLPIYPEGVAYLAAGHRQAAGEGPRIRVGHPPAEPDALLREVGRELRRLPAVAAASRAWLTVAGEGEGLVLSVRLDDPASAAAHTAVVEAVERALASLPRQPGHPVDVTFPGESAPDVVDDWIAGHASPFYTRDGGASAQCPHPGPSAGLVT